MAPRKKTQARSTNVDAPPHTPATPTTQLNLPGTVVNSGGRWDAPTLLRTNMKGVEREYRLAACTAFTGDNERGKSAAVSSLRAALVGRLPGYAVNNGKAVLRLANDGDPTLTCYVESPSWTGTYSVVRDTRPSHELTGTLKDFDADARLDFFPQVELAHLVNLDTRAARAETVRRWGVGTKDLTVPPDALTPDAQELWRAWLAEEAPADADPAEALTALIARAGAEKDKHGAKALNDRIVELEASITGKPRLDADAVEQLKLEARNAERWESGAQVRATIAQYEAEQAQLSSYTEALLEQQRQVTDARARLEQNRAATAEAIARARSTVDDWSRRIAVLEAQIGHLPAFLDVTKAMLMQHVTACPFHELSGEILPIDVQHVHDRLFNDVAGMREQISQAQRGREEAAAAVMRLEAHQRTLEEQQVNAERGVVGQIGAFKARFAEVSQQLGALRGALTGLVQPTEAAATLRARHEEAVATNTIRGQIAAIRDDFAAHEQQKAHAKAIETAADQRLRPFVEALKTTVEAAVNAKITPGLVASFDPQHGWQARDTHGVHRSPDLLSGFVHASLAIALALAWRRNGAPAWVILDDVDLAPFSAGNVPRFLTHLADLVRDGELTGVYVSWSRRSEIPQAFLVHDLDAPQRDDVEAARRAEQERLVATAAAQRQPTPQPAGQTWITNPSMLCAICRYPQFAGPDGKPTCPNGHTGAFGLPHGPQAQAQAQAQVQAQPATNGDVEARTQGW